MATDVTGRAAAMQRAGQGDIVGAIDALRDLVEADDPEDRLLLGRMAFVATDYAEAQVQLERAYRDFQARGLPRRAAMAASALANLHFAGLDETVVARGWRARWVCWRAKNRALSSATPFSDRQAQTWRAPKS